MKLTILLLTVAILNAHASGVAQNITLSGKDLTLKQVFIAIEKQTGYVVINNKGVIDDTKKISLSVFDLSLSKFLDVVLKDSPLEYTIEDRTIIIARKLTIPLPVVSSDPPNIVNFLPITGIVRDASGLPLHGASVQVKGKKISTITDNRGQFALTADIGDILVVSFVGFVSIEVKVRDKSVVEVQLERNEVNLEDVIVSINTGYQTLPTERATGSFDLIDNKVFNSKVGSSILNRLDGIIPSLSFNPVSAGITRTSGVSKISIRGRSTLGANAEPLIVLDNFPYEGNVDDLNPDDIESITILKDAAAASIWGARAGNGVIVITSKVGKFNQRTRVSYSGSWMTSKRPNLYYSPTVPIEDYIEIERMLFEKGAWNSPLTTPYTYVTPAIELMDKHKKGHLTDIELEEQLDILKSQDVRRDLLKYVYRPTSLFRNSITLDGGTASNNYYFSVGHDNNQRNVQYSESDRITINFRSNYRLLKDRLTFSGNVLFSHNTEYTPFSVVYRTLYDRLADNQGNPVSIGAGKELRQSYIDTAGAGFLEDWDHLPLEEISDNGNFNKRLLYQIGGTLNYKIKPWVSAEVTYRYNAGNGSTNSLRKKESFYVRNERNKFSKLNRSTGEVISAIPYGDILQRYRNDEYAHYFRTQVNVNKNWGMDHQFSALAGGEISDNNTGSFSDATWFGYDPSTERYTPFDVNASYPYFINNGTRNIINKGIVNQVYSSTTNRKRLYFANASFTYINKYTITVSARKDEANIFGVATNMRGKPFWSGGILWHLDQESFLKSTAISKLKFRVTRGIMGNVGNTSGFMTTYAYPSPYYLTGRKYQSISNPPNPSLSWEKVSMTNLALEFGFWNNRLSGTMEKYFKRSTDLLSSESINPSSGVNSLYGNWSSMKSGGWDFSLTSQNLIGKLKWQTNLNVSKVWDYVTHYKSKHSNDGEYLGGGLGIGAYPIVGRSKYSIFSYPFAGLNAEGNPQIFKDGVISTNYTDVYNNFSLAQYIYHGRAIPGLFGNVQNSLSYREFELSINITFQLQYYFRRSGLNSSSIYGVQSLAAAAIFQSDYDKRWQKPGDELITNVPSLIYPNISGRDAVYAGSSALVEKGDHARLQDIRLGYNVVNNWIKRIGVSSLQVYGYVKDLGILWSANKLGLDPNLVPANDIKIPASTSFALGLNVKL